MLHQVSHPLVRRPGHVRPEPCLHTARWPVSPPRACGRRRRVGAASRRQRGFAPPLSRSPTMEPNSERTPPEQTRPPAHRKRFRIQKLEERIAPAKGGNKHTAVCSDTWLTGNCTTTCNDTAVC